MKTKSKPESHFAHGRLFLLPQFLLVTIVPLIVYLRIIPVESAIVPFYDNRAENFDFFSYYKSIGIIVLASLSLVSLIIGILVKRVKITKLYSIYIPAALFALCAILSAVLSEYQHTAIFGFPDRYEGLWVLLSYMFILITSINLIKDEGQIKFLLSGIIISSSVIGIIGIFQCIGLDMFTSSFGRLIILSSEYRNTTAAITTSQETQAIYSTLYNPNNFGMYISMMVCISFCLFMFVRGKSHKAASFAYFCLMLINLLGSNSRGSIAAAFLAILLVIILIRKQVKQNWKPFIVTITACAVIFAGMNFFGDGTLSARLGSMFTGKDLHKENAAIDKIKSFEIRNTQLLLHCSSSSLKISVDNNRLVFTDDSDNSLNAVSTGQEKSYTFKESNYKDYIITISQNMIKVQKGVSYLYFAFSGDTFLYLNNRGEAVNNKPVESFGFKGMERIGSGRGYIWSRTLPLLKSTLLIGHGPDTFAMYFPQNDYNGKLRYLYDANIIIDKPHNMYLQTAVNTGVLSLIALLIVILIYWSGSLGLLTGQGLQKNGTAFNKNSIDQSLSRIACLAIFAAVTCYLAAGLFADSTVSVSPTFWMLLGSGIGMNQYLKDKSQK